MTQKLKLSFYLLYNPRMTVCGVCDGKIKTVLILCNFSWRHLTWTQPKEICIGVSFKVLQKEQRTVFVIPKVYNFFIEKKYVIKSFVNPYLSLILTHDMILPFFNSCNLKLISLLENLGKLQYPQFQCIC